MSETKPPRHVVNKVFGDALTAASSDERDDRESEEDAGRDRWLRENVPPHHG